MYKHKHGSISNFNFILEKCKERYVPFNKKVDKKRKPGDIVAAIRDSKKSGRNAVIAEIKYRSPTMKTGLEENPEDIALEMVKGGACAISVLTEPEFFGGSLEFLKKVKAISTVPVLRKDFIFHPTQIPESYYWGADSVLLISSFFTLEDLIDMVEDTRSFGMEPLVEVHNTKDIYRAIDAGAKLFAINNRDKDTLKIDLSRTAKMAPIIKGVKISASGIMNPSQLREVLRYTDGALIGSSIMESAEIKSKVAELVEA
jgi:indole-3-glycerol phosphate synthase